MFDYEGLRKEINEFDDEVCREIDKKLLRQYEANVLLLDEAKVALVKKKSKDSRGLYHLAHDVIGYLRWYNERRKWLPARHRKWLISIIVPIEGGRTPYEEIKDYRIHYA